MFNKRLRSFKYAFQGLADVIRSQANAKIHLIVGTLAVVAGFVLKLSALEWVTLVLTIALVLAAEAFNTALEYLTDLVSPDIHPLAGKAKDAAAAAVLLLAIGAVIVGIILFLPKLLSLAGNFNG